MTNLFEITNFNVRFHCVVKTIYCTVTVNKERSTAFSTYVRVNPEKWDAKAQSTKDKILDEELSVIRHRLYNIKNVMTSANMVITAKTIRDFYLDQHTIYPNIIEFLDLYSKNVLSQRIKSTRIAYQKHINNFKRFFVENQKASIKVNEIDYKLIYEFQDWFKDRKPITINKNIKTFKMTLKHAVKEKVLKEDPLAHWEYLKVDTLEKIYLTVDELMQWATFPLKSEKFKGIRDLFTWMSLTGMYKKDVDKFTEEHFKRVQGKLFIDTFRDKNGSRYCLPVHPIAWNIWEQYKGIFPIMSEQKINRCLKELAYQMGIDKDLSIKSGRKTFGNFMESHGMDAQTIADMMGHKSYNMTRKHYTNVQVEGIALKTEKLISNWNSNFKVA